MSGLLTPFDPFEPGNGLVDLQGLRKSKQAGLPSCLVVGHLVIKVIRGAILRWLERRIPTQAIQIPVLCALALVAACSVNLRPSPPPSLTPIGKSEPTSTPTPVESPGGVPVVDVIAVGDIASCRDQGDEQTAALVDGLSGEILLLGDLAYDRGTHQEFADCYNPSWGRHKGRTHPAPGNHEYGTPNAAGYFDYFGDGAGSRGQGWYSFGIGSWRVIALNSNCFAVDCRQGSQQERWLREELTAHPARCTVAFWHHPRFGSGKVHGAYEPVAPLWDALFDAGAELVLSGHEHHYERFTSLDRTGNPDGQRGLRQFIVGTGGRSLYEFGEVRAGSEARFADSLGVLILSLGEDFYRWRFAPVPPGGSTDSGEGVCHD